MITVAELLDALECANNVMKLSQGDAWERECTQHDRIRFNEIYQKAFPSCETIVAASEHYWSGVSANFVCPFCDKALSSSMGLCLHLKDKHKLSYRSARAKTRSLMNAMGLVWRKNDRTDQTAIAKAWGE